jgi:MarR family transcriptional regulator, organic hydroperoxide resistance regulator
MPRILSSEDHEDLVKAEEEVRARIGDMPLDLTSMAAISNIYRAATAVRNRLEKELLSHYGLSWGGFTTLFVLWIWGQRETGELAVEVGVSKGTLSGMVKTLTRARFVETRVHPHDRRRVLVKLTARGLKTIEEAFPRFHAYEVKLTDSMSERQQRELAGYLRRIVRAAQSP